MIHSKIYTIDTGSMSFEKQKDLVKNLKRIIKEHKDAQEFVKDWNVVHKNKKEQVKITKKNKEK